MFAFRCGRGVQLRRRKPSWVWGLLGLAMILGTVPASLAQQQEDTSSRGQVVSVEQIGERTASEIAQRFQEEGLPGEALYGVRLLRIVYQTVDVEGRTTDASGALAIPIDLAEPAAVISYHHGTTVAHQRAPSVQGFDLVSMGLGASGYVTALPDYLGLGIDEGLHPYVHAASLSTSIIDFLRAAGEVLDEEGVLTNGQLFLMGYSEGGYATMAVHREIETKYADELDVTASAPMAGPYSLSEAMVDQILEDDPYPSPMYLPFTILAYNSIYRLFDDLGTVFLDPWSSTLLDLFDGSHSLHRINDQLPRVPLHMLQPTFVEAFKEDKMHPLRQALEANDAFRGWVPQAPMRLHHCLEDDQVAYRNAEIAMAYFEQAGGHRVELSTLAFGDHEACAAPALYLGKMWFDQLRSAGAPAMQANLNDRGVSGQ